MTHHKMGLYCAGLDNTKNPKFRKSFDFLRLQSQSMFESLIHFTHWDFSYRMVVNLFQIVFFEIRQFQQVAQQANFQRLTSMNGYRNTFHLSRLAIYMMASLNSQQVPSLLFKNLCKLRARNRFHTATSNTCASPVKSYISKSTERQASIAS